MVQKFEVGKLYKSSSAGSIVECLWHDDKDALVRHWKEEAGTKGSPVLVSERTCQNYEEYKPPVVVKTRLSLWKRKDGSVFACLKSGWEFNYSDYLKDIEITLTDGKLTDVKIL